MALGRIGLAVALLALTPAGAGAQPDPAPAADRGALPAAVPAVTAGDRVEGRADAAVTVIEYGSFACPHCADWHELIYPEFKRRLIDTGQIRYVFRNLPTPPEEMSLPAAALARCADPDKYFAVAAALMHGQAAVRYGGTLDAWYAPAIAASGRTREQIVACTTTPAVRAAINADITGAYAAGIDTTPTFVIDGQVIGDHSLGGLEAAVHAAARRRAP